MHFWEYNSTDLDGTPIGMSRRHPATREPVLPADAELIENNSNPAYVLDGWDPLSR